jgi:hypothetical protein
MSIPPDPPDTIPQYILDALNRQGPDTLREIAARIADNDDSRYPPIHRLISPHIEM